jgi:hypothetical protein
LDELVAFGQMWMLVYNQKWALDELSFWKDDDVVNYSINPKWALGELVAFGQMWMLVYNQKWALDEYPFGRMMMLLTIP